MPVLHHKRTEPAVRRSSWAQRVTTDSRSVVPSDLKLLGFVSCILAAILLATR